MIQNSVSDWRKLFQEMVSETDGRKLPERIAAVESAVFFRYQEVERSSDGAAERAALQGAIEVLLNLKNHKPRFTKANGRWAGGSSLV